MEGAEEDFIAIDSTVVKVHKHGSASVGGQKESIERSCDGITIKINAVTDPLGKSLSLTLIAGNVYDSKLTCSLLDKQQTSFRVFVVIVSCLVKIINL